MSHCSAHTAVLLDTLCCSVVVEATAGLAGETIVSLADVRIVGDDPHVALLHNIHNLLFFGHVLCLPARSEGGARLAHACDKSGLLNFLSIDLGHPVAVARVILFVLDWTPACVQQNKYESLINGTKKLLDKEEQFCSVCAGTYF